MAALLTDLVVENYQAIGSATFRLGKFTVVTGPTGSGKSAVIRAFKLVVFNARGTSYIRHGAKGCKVAIGSQDQGWVVAIERAGRGSDAYRIAQLPANPLSSGVDVQDYTKLGGQVPPEVAELLKFSELNFAAQFDRPYLLDESGASIARILGRLTNVDLVFEAAREGYRRKLGIASALTRARTDVAKLADQVGQYAALPAQRAACTRAEAALDRVVAAQKRVAVVTHLAETAIAAHAAVHVAQAAVDAAEPPSLATLDHLEARVARLAELARELNDSEADIATHQIEVDGWGGLELQAHDAIHKVLIDAGTCPTCGQEIDPAVQRAAMVVASQEEAG